MTVKMYNSLTIKFVSCDNVKIAILSEPNSSNIKRISELFATISRLRLVSFNVQDKREFLDFYQDRQNNKYKIK